MKKSLIALAAFSVIGSAYASDPVVTVGDNRNGSVSGSAAYGGVATSTANGGIARQEQAQAQSIDNSGNSFNANLNRIRTGDVTNTAGGATLGDGVGSATLSGSFGGAGGAGGTGTASASLSNSGNGTGTASGNSLVLAPGALGGGNVYRSNDRAWAPVIHGPGAAPVASAALMAVPGICGMRVDVVYDEVKGQRFEQVGRDKEFVQGYTERTVPAKVPFVEFNGYLIGHSVTTVVGALGTSSAGSFSLGLFGKNGEGAQGGAAGGSSHQQLVTKTVVQDCVFAQPAPIVAAAPMPLPVIPKTGE